MPKRWSATSAARTPSIERPKIILFLTSALCVAAVASALGGATLASGTGLAAVASGLGSATLASGIGLAAVASGLGSATLASAIGLAAVASALGVAAVASGTGSAALASASSLFIRFPRLLRRDVHLPYGGSGPHTR